MRRELKSIIFINQSSGYLMIDIVNQATIYYDKVYLITGDLNIRNKNIKSSVGIYRTVNSQRNSAFLRIWSWTIAYIQIMFYMVYLGRKHELFIVTNPPLSVFLPCLSKRKISFLVYDVYPDALVQHKILKSNSILAKIWAKRNQKIFKSSDKVFTISEGMRLRLEQYVDQKKINNIPIWTDNEFFQPIAKQENPFILEHELLDKFVVMYSGNLGITHDLGFLITLAKEFRDSDLVVLIIGEGARKKELATLVKQNKLRNCIVLPWQPMHVLPYSLAAADLGVVSLGVESGSLSLPSKTFNLMSVKLPILGIADDSSELATLIKKHEIGKVFSADDQSGIIEFVERLKTDFSFYSELSKNSLKASEYFTPENAKLFFA